MHDGLASFTCEGFRLNKLQGCSSRVCKRLCSQRHALVCCLNDDRDCDFIGIYMAQCRGLQKTEDLWATRAAAAHANGVRTAHLL